jgi:hypothetical protein
LKILEKNIIYLASGINTQKKKSNRLSTPQTPSTAKGNANNQVYPSVVAEEKK